MRRKIPSIEALIAFEAASRHLSFTRAADELFLTQSAVGRQIASLEKFLGTPLFSRIKKRVSLTDVGLVYARSVREHLDKMEQATLEAMSQRGAGGILELAVIPTFTTRWLIPRLPEFCEKHPDITLNLTTRTEPFLFTDTPFDAAIHFGNPVWPGSVTKHLFGEEIIPVCSPKLLKTPLPLKPENLETFTLLHQSMRPYAWRKWFSLSGIYDFNSMKGPRFELFSMLVEAARAGLGIALVPRFFVQHELLIGELVTPCEMTLKTNKGYYLVYPERKQSSTILQAFEQWLLQAAQQHREANL
ncbi:MAG: transcriptional regulator GcvA [Pseudomonadota bacterium]